MKFTVIWAKLIFALFAVASSKASVVDQLSKLLPSDGTVDDAFGWSVKIDGNLAIVGTANSAGAYVFDVTTGKQISKFVPIEAGNGGGIGFRVDISGHTGIAGDPTADNNGSSFGSAYLFDAVSGTQLTKLTTSDGTGSHGFGASVALSGNLAIIGAPGDDGKNLLSGSAYLFDITTGEQLMKFTASEVKDFNFFGYSVDISGDTAIVGARYDFDHTDPGSAYLFDVATGEQLAKLIPSDESHVLWFGHSVAIDGNVAIVGTPNVDSNGYFSGAAYVFDVSSGKERAKLTPNDAKQGSWFGTSVGISGNIVVVGAGEDDAFGQWSGSAYVFDLTSGKQLAKLPMKSGTTYGEFGWSVGIDGNTAIVGEVGTGSAYLYSIIPEPSTLYLATLAAANLLLRRRR